MKTRLNLLKRAAAVTLAGITVLTFTSCQKTPSPMETVEEAINENLDRIEKSEFYTTLDKVANGGSVEIRANLARLIEIMSGYSLDLDAQIKLYPNIDKEALALAADIGLSGTSVLDLLLYGNSKSVAVTSDSLLDGDAYGIPTDNLESDIRNSVFGHGGELEIDTDYYGGYFDLLFALPEILKNSEIRKDIFEDFLDEITPAIYDSIEENGDAKMAVGNMDTDDGKIATIDIALDLSAKDFLDVWVDSLTALKNSKKLDVVIENFYDVFSLYLSIADGYDYDLTAEEFYDDLIETIEYVLDDIAEYDIDEIPDADFDITIRTAKKTGELLLIEVQFDVDNDSEGSIEIAFPTSLTPDFVFSVDTVSDYGYENNYLVKYDVKEDSDEEYRATLFAESDDEKIDLAKIKWDKESGKYSLDIYGDGDSDYLLLGVKGSCSSDSKAKTITVTDITIDDENYSIGEISIILNYFDKMPTIGRFENLFAMTADELQELIESAADSFGGFGASASADYY